MSWALFLLKQNQDALIFFSTIKFKKADNYLYGSRDDDGGVPGSHIAQIMGSSQFDASRALAAGVLAYANEPRTGTLHQVQINKK